MLIFKKGDKSHAELERLAKQVRCSFDDLAPVQSAPSALHQPKNSAEVSALLERLYQLEGERISSWAKASDLLVDKSDNGKRGLVYLSKGTIAVEPNRVFVSIVVPIPRTGKGESSVIDPAATPCLRVGVRISTSIGSGSMFTTLPQLKLEAGDVVILAPGEKLTISNTAVGDRGICLVSALHEASRVGDGLGGWR